MADKKLLPQRRRKWLRILEILSAAAILLAVFLYPSEWKNRLTYQLMSSKEYYLKAERRNVKKLLKTIPLACKALEFLPLLFSINSENQLDLTLKVEESLAERLFLPGTEPFGITFTQKNGKLLSEYQGLLHYKGEPVLNVSFLIDAEGKRAFLGLEELSSSWLLGSYEEWEKKTGIDLEAVFSHQKLIELLSALSVEPGDLKTLFSIYTDFVLEQLEYSEPELIRTDKQNSFAEVTISCSISKLFSLCADFLQTLCQNDAFLKLAAGHSSYSEPQLLGMLSSVRSLFTAISGKTWDNGEFRIVTTINRRGWIENRTFHLTLPLDVLISKLAGYRIGITANTPDFTEGFDLSVSIFNETEQFANGSLHWSGFYQPEEVLLPEDGRCISFSQASSLITPENVLQLLSKVQRLFGEAFYNKMILRWSGRFPAHPLLPFPAIPSQLPEQPKELFPTSPPEKPSLSPVPDITKPEPTISEKPKQEDPNKTGDKTTGEGEKQGNASDTAKHDDSDNTAEDPEPDKIPADPTAEAPEAYPYSGYLTLGSYRNLPVSHVILEVTEEELDAEVFSYLSLFSELTAIDRPAQKGDTMIIDYLMTIAGLPFFSGEGHELVLGSSKFPFELENALYGARPGTVVTVNYTLPEDAGLFAGFPTVCRFSVKQVLAKSIPELTDEFVQQHTGLHTTEEFLENIHLLLVMQKQEEAKANQLAEIISAILSQSVIHTYPKEEIRQYREKLVLTFQASVADSGMSEEEFVSSSFGISTDEFYRELARTAEEAILSEMVLFTVLQKEGVQVTGDMLPEIYDTFREKYYYDSTEALLKAHPKEELLRTWLLSYAQDFLLHVSRPPE